MGELRSGAAAGDSRGPATPARRLHVARPRRITRAAVVSAPFIVTGLIGFVVVPPPAGAASALAGSAWRSTEILAPSNALPSPQATLDAVACAGPGSCAGGGLYESKAKAFDPMVVSESKGTWARPQELRLPSNAFVANPVAPVNSIACTTVRSCVAVGAYDYNNSGGQHGFIATESKSGWGRASQVTLPANAAVRGSSATLGAVTCVGSGSCLAVGGYLDRAGGFELMVVPESNGHWGQAREITAPSNGAAKPDATLDGVACWRAGSCAAVGAYADKSHHFQPLAVAESNGHWGHAAEIAVPSNAGPDPGAVLAGVGCSSTGACTAVGGYFDKTAASHAMAVSSTRHGWARATEIRPPRASGFEAASLDAVSCTAAGSCVAVGSYILNFAAVPMAAIESAGKWTPAINITPPKNELTGMNRDATLLSVACIKGHACTALGWYVDRSHRQQAMAATRSTP
jgi:hypothetical protein